MAYNNDNLCTNCGAHISEPCDPNCNPSNALIAADYIAVGMRFADGSIVAEVHEFMSAIRGIFSNGESFSYGSGEYVLVVNATNNDADAAYMADAIADAYGYTD